MLKNKEEDITKTAQATVSVATTVLLEKKQDTHISSSSLRIGHHNAVVNKVSTTTYMMGC